MVSLTYNKDRLLDNSFGVLPLKRSYCLKINSDEASGSQLFEHVSLCARPKRHSAINRAQPGWDKKEGEGGREGTWEKKKEE